jgi:16S rRNA (cytosine1402-N4)-methyltransferase
MNTYHVPVLLKEVIDYLNPQPGKRFIDATLGGGGHTKVMLARGSSVLAIDRDPDAIAHAREHLKEFLYACPELPQGAPGKPGQAALILAKGDFAEIDTLAQRAGFDQVDGILFDLGVSSHQLGTPPRGFSFNTEGPLDMRMDPDSQSITAADLINSLSPNELAQLFKNFGQEPRASAIAHAIVRARRIKPITKTIDLSRVILRARSRTRGDRTHPATRVFQALRIAVNSELESLKLALPQVPGVLSAGGVFVALSFHSLEDRLVKQFLKSTKAMKILTNKPIIPEDSEINQNPRARSVKMRVAVKI